MILTAPMEDTPSSWDTRSPDSPSTRLRISYASADPLHEALGARSRGEPPAAQQEVELPFVVGVLADLSGADRGALPHLRNRRFEAMTLTTLADRLNCWSPERRRALETTETGLEHLLRGASAGTDVQVLVLDVSKAELLKCLRMYRGQALEHNPLAQEIVEARFGSYGGEPFGCLIGDYLFDHSQEDVEALEDLGHIAAASHAVFVTGASPALVQLPRWEDVAHRRSIDALFSLPEYGGWSALVASEAANALVLTLPGDAFLIGAAIARAFGVDGSWRRLEAVLAELASHLRSVSLPSQHGEALARCGVSPVTSSGTLLMTMRGSPLRNALLFGRFAHHAHAMLRERRHSFGTPAAAEQFVTRWLLHYVDGAHRHSSEGVKATLPLVDARVSAEETAIDGGYRCHLSLTTQAVPHDTHRPPTNAAWPTRTKMCRPVGRHDGEAQLRLPFVVGILADASGDNPDSQPPRERRFSRMTLGSLDDRLRLLEPRVICAVRDVIGGREGLAVDLTFECLEDFHPASVARRVPSLRPMLEKRERLMALLVHLDGKPRARAALDRVFATATGPHSKGDVVLESLVAAFEPLTSSARATVELALEDAIAIPGPHTSTAPDAALLVSNVVCEIDRQLTLQVNEVMHAPAFQSLERTWLGIERLVRAADIDPFVEVHLLDIAKDELDVVLVEPDAPGSLQEHLLRELSAIGGRPFSMLIGDFCFDHRESDVRLLHDLAHAAAKAHCPFVGAACPSLMTMESWRQAGMPRDLLTIFKDPDHDGWRALRADPESRSMVLTLPRFLGRQPWSSAETPVLGFGFAESTVDHEHFVWLNAAFAVGEVVVASVLRHGSPAFIQGVNTGGLLPLPDSTEGHRPLPHGVETALTDRRAHALSECGLAALVARAGGSAATFFLIPSLFQPLQHLDEEATRHSVRSSRLDWCLQVGRIAHHVRRLACEVLGAYPERDAMQRHLNEWLSSHVSCDPGNAGIHALAELPLLAADLAIEERDGSWQATLRVLPDGLWRGGGVRYSETIQFPIPR